MSTDPSGYDAKGYDAKGYGAKGYDSMGPPNTLEEGKAELDKPSPEAPPQIATWVFLFLSLCLAVFCQALDNTILATAIPRITDEFNSLDDVGWYGSSYLLTTCAFQLSYGKLYNLFPIKWVFLTAVGFFQLGSLICGAAPSSFALIMGRAIAGIGSGGLFSGALLVVAQNIPLQQRPLYNGLLGSMYAISSVAGPLMGGAFTDKVTWRLCFYINLPIGAVTVVAIWFFLDREAGKNDRWELPLREKFGELDLLGVGALIPAIVCVLLGLQFGSATFGWNNWRVILLFVLSALLFIAFVSIQFWKGDKATVPPSAVKVRTMWACALFAFFFFGSFLSITYYLPIWFQAIRGDSATQSGIDNLPFLLGTVIFSIVAGAAVFGTGYYTWATILGAGMAATGAGLLSTFEVSTPKSQWIGYQILYGAGIGFGLQQPLIAVQTALPDRQVSEGTAIITFVQAFGGTVFIAVAQSIFNNQLVKNVASRNIPINPVQLLSDGATSLTRVAPQGYLESLREAYNAAITQTFYVTVATAALSTVGAFCLPWLSLKTQKPADESGDDGLEMTPSDQNRSRSPENGYDAKGYDTKGYESKGYDSKGYDDKGHDTGPDDLVHDSPSPIKELPRLPFQRQPSNFSLRFSDKFNNDRPDPRDQQYEKEVQLHRRETELHERNAQLFDKKARLYDKNVELYERNMRLYDMSSRLYDKSVNRVDREAEAVGLSSRNRY